ncbi:MAG: hypothetical protein ACK4YQ_07730 [Phenylobacterium sp.]|uniref:hypothetical protein n=1 Tax=Phenylobacterium sp. TaxID=1871053 RepID=UPI00391CE730
MRTAVIAFAAAGLFASGSAMAADTGTDMDFLKASRCRGLAQAGTLTPVDAKALDSYVKAAERVRAGYILERARNEEARAKREARDKNHSARLSAELNGACMAYMGGAAPTATASAQSGAPVQN